MPAALPEVPGVEHEWVTIASGLRVHVALAGPADGPPVVLLHGWPQHWWCWRGVIGPLAGAGFRVIAPDLRGSGWTDAPAAGYDKEQLATDLLGLLDALGIDTLHALVGHDWGGWTAQLVALRAPERVGRLVLVNIAPVFGEQRGMRRHLVRFLYQPLMGAPRLGPAVQASPLMARLGFPGLGKADAAVFARALREPGRAEAGSLMYRTFLREEVLPVLKGRYRDARFAMPTLVLHGLDDPVIRPSMVEGYRGRADDMTILWCAGAGHFVADERPDWVSARVLSFI